jgi:tetratricopeptide (TPR) repeat protein
VEQLNTTDGLGRRFTWFLVILLLAGSLARFAYLYAQQHSDPWLANPTADAAANLAWAHERLGGLPLPTDAFELPPLYPLFLTALFRVVGETLPLLFFVQHLMMVAAAGLAALALRRLVGPEAALAAAAIFLLYGPHQFFASRALGEPLAIFLMCAALYAWVAGSGAGAGALAGLIAGVASVARPNLLLVGPLWALGNAKSSLRRSLILMIGLTLALVPTAVRNLSVSGHLVPVSSNSGLTLYHGNGPQATGFIHIPPELAQSGKGDQRRIATWVASQRSGRQLDGVEADRYWGQQAVRARLADPIGSVKLMLRRVMLLVWNAELTLTAGPRQDPNPLRWLAPLPFALLLGLAAAGVVVVGWRGSGGWIVWSTVAACAVAPLVFYVSSRYRLPMASVLCLPAGAGLVALVRPPASSPSRRRWVGLGLLAVVTLGSFAIPGGGVLAQADAAGLVNRARAWMRVGDFSKAEADYRQALELHPGWAPALFKLGELLFETGRGAEAEKHYALALQARPEYADAACALGGQLNQSARYEEALPLLRRGLQFDPQQEICWHNLVAALALTGRFDEADSAMERAAGQDVVLRPRVRELVAALREESATDESNDTSLAPSEPERGR